MGDDRSGNTAAIWEGAVYVSVYAAAEQYFCPARATYPPGLLPKSLEGLQLA